MVEGTLDRTVPAPVAPRLQKPSWRDTRLVIGLLLVLGSVVAGARIVAVADRTVPVYAAARTLSSGTTLDASMLKRVDVHLEGTASYLRADRELPSGAVVLRTVGAGEIVPTASLGSASALTSRPVTLTLDDDVPPGLEAGSRVDVWASPRVGTAGTTYGSARRLVGAAEVASVGNRSDGLTARREVPVQVLVGVGEVAAVLDAIAGGSRIALVPVPGTSTGGS